MLVANPNIFRQYDIRGVVGKDFNEYTARVLGQAFGTFSLKQNEKVVLVGNDNRTTSPALKQALIEGLLSTGCDVVDLGTVVTPMFYYARLRYRINAGIMVTASHNPAEFNGFKVAFHHGTIYGEKIQELRIAMEKGDFILGKRGELFHRDIVENYIDMICDAVILQKPLRVGVDCGNGTASLFAEKLLAKLGVEVYPLYCDSDPSFPHHFPDPVKPENLQDLKALVLRKGLDLGIGFDGDGDRIGVVDDQGKIIYGDLLMILFWREILPHHPGTVAIVEVKCSEALVEEIKKLGGHPLYYKTGHSLIKAKMREVGAVFTGEMSGHMFFADEYYGYDDAFYAAARLLRILSKTDMPLSQLLTDVPHFYFTPELRVSCPDEEKSERVEMVKAYFRDEYPMIEVDGARVLFPDGWGLVRSSNTGPELIVRCEAKTEEGLEYIKARIAEALMPLIVDF